MARMEAMQRNAELKEQQGSDKQLHTVNDELIAAMEKAVEKAVQRQMQVTVVPAMHKYLQQSAQAQQAHISQILKQTVSSSIQPMLPKCEKQVKDTMDKIVANQANSTQLLAASMRQPLAEAFRECVGDMLLPAFEKSCLVMFSQIHQTFDHTLQERAAGMACEQNGKLNGTMDELYSMVSQMQASIDSIAAQAECGTADKMPTTPSPNSASSKDCPPAGPQQDSSALKAEVTKLVAEMQYEQAFTKVLSVSSLELVEWLCNSLDSRTILATPLPVSQVVLISLIQQLGFQLKQHTVNKLTWLRDALLVLDGNDPLIAQHKTAILTQLQTNLQSMVAADGRWTQDTLHRSTLRLLNNFIP